MNTLRFSFHRVAATALAFTLSAFAVNSASAQWGYPGYPRAYQPAQNYEWVSVEGFEDQQEAQQTMVWCWAASINAVLRHYGFPSNQAGIVAGVYGQPVPMPSMSPNQYVSFVNNLRWDDGSRVVRMSGAIPYLSPRDLRRELEAGSLLIYWHVSGPQSCHVVVVYGAAFDGYGNVVGFRVFDPSPFAQRHYEIDAARFNAMGTSINLVRPVRS